VNEDRQVLRVASEYRCYPTWLIDADGSTDNPSPKDLGLDEDLSRDLLAWADAFDAIFPEDDPGFAAFSSPAAEAAFFDQGEILARRVKRVVGDRYEVVYLRDLRDPPSWFTVTSDAG